VETHQFALGEASAVATNFYDLVVFSKISLARFDDEGVLVFVRYPRRLTADIITINCVADFESRWKLNDNHLLLSPVCGALAD
jgi:hypothetical protein